MTRDEAYQTLTVYTQSQNLIRHHLAAEAAMRAIAKYLTDRTRIPYDEDEWGITGLLHDADYELTRKTPERHTLYLEEKLGKQIPERIMHAIKAHNYNFTQVKPVTTLDWAIYTCDELTGFIVACTLVIPDKKLKSVTVDFVLKKMQEKSFAKSVNREQIKMCEETLEIPLREFVRIVLTVMQKIDGELGLS